MAIRAVIFDFGGVFVDSPFTTVAHEASARGLSVEDLTMAVFGDYASDTDHPWHQLERGEMTMEETRDRIMAASALIHETPLDPFELLAVLAGGGVREDFVSFCASVRERGMKTGLLTNNAREFEEFWHPVLPLEDLFDDVVDSSRVGLRKPDPAIYHLALERLGVEPAESIFVDDAPGNVAGAEMVGMSAVLVGPERTDVPSAIAAVEALLR